MEPVFALLNASSPVKALLGTSPLRAWPFGDAPEEGERPYATWSVLTGLPQNRMDSAPDTDAHTVQVDIWAETAASCRACYAAVRDALEPAGHMTNFALAERDQDTKLYRARMEFDFFTAR